MGVFRKVNDPITGDRTRVAENVEKAVEIVVAARRKDPEIHARLRPLGTTPRDDSMEITFLKLRRPKEKEQGKEPEST